MRVPYNWLKSYIDFPYSPQELAKQLTMAGLEVEAIENLGQGLEGVVVGGIEKIDEHPNADKLVICKVNIGSEVLQLVTGAPNVRENIKVPVAPVGVTLPGGMEIEKTNLRGKMSSGMICSEDELGLIEERADGIMILEDDARVGEKFIEYMGKDEYVLKLDLTPNYARCLGMIGIAREIKALLPDKEINYPEFEIENTSSEKIEEQVGVKIEDSDLCPRYTGRLIKNVEIGPSPEWMQQRLEAAGVRPINNVVDITNYILLEYNQPLHAFDYDSIDGKDIIVRRAKKEEKLVTLDDQERQLNEEILVIADKKKALGLAGVMGGANSEVTADTVNIFLEAAYFKPENIRKTARSLGLPSDASHRFERGIDIEKLIEASNRAAYLMQQYAGGEIVKGIIDEYPDPVTGLKIDLNVERVNEILGIELSREKMVEMLKRLEFTIQESDTNILKVEVPSYRNDVERQADLIEEVARMYGYNKIPVTRTESSQQGKRTREQKLRDIVKETMISSGLDEIITFSLMGKDIYDKLKISAESKLRNWVEIKNPLNKAFSIMRISLLPGLIKVLSNNSKRQLEELGFFELGKVFFDHGAGERPQEKMMLVGGSMGYSDDFWQNEAGDFFYLKGILENLFDRFDKSELKFEAASKPYLHPGRTAKIIYDNQEIGVIGELLPGLIKEFDLGEGTTIFQLDFEFLEEEVELGEYKYVSLPKFPAVSRDLAIVVKQNIAAGDILSLIRKTGGKLLKSVELFDLYQGDQISEGCRSLAFKLLFQAQDRTLTDQEVDDIFEKVVSDLEEEFDAKLRRN